jgi:hypothetical protein
MAKLDDFMGGEPLTIDLRTTYQTGLSDGSMRLSATSESGATQR